MDVSERDVVDAEGYRSVGHSMKKGGELCQDLMEPDREVWGR